MPPVPRFWGPGIAGRTSSGQAGAWLTLISGCPSRPHVAATQVPEGRHENSPWVKSAAKADENPGNAAPKTPPSPAGAARNPPNHVPGSAKTRVRA